MSAFTAHAAAWRNRLTRAAWCVDYGDAEAKARRWLERELRRRRAVEGSRYEVRL